MQEGWSNIYQLCPTIAWIKFHKYAFLREVLMDGQILAAQFVAAQKHPAEVVSLLCIEHVSHVGVYFMHRF